ncbi:MAG TPA: phosphoglycolate phosphatase [Usitatibacter sp.]|nr:phosphoglycolate phosphatase [Usitatibacter sp.]
MAGLLAGARAVAFDLDGTLVDSAPDLAAAANAMLVGEGLPPLAEARVAAAIGDGIDALVARVLEESAGHAPDAQTVAHAAHRFRELYARDVFTASRVFPGVREGLERLAALGLPVGCVTNKARVFTAKLLDLAGLASRLAFVECPETPGQRKPAPFLLLKACRDLGIAPGELLYVGDSALDVAAARAARSAVVLVDYGYNRGRAAAEEGADAVIGSLEDLAGTRGGGPS